MIVAYFERKGCIQRNLYLNWIGYLITVIRTQQGSIILIYLTELFLIRNGIILAVRKKICSLPSSDGCPSGVRWLFGVKIPSTLLKGGVGEVDVVFGIHIFFEIGKGHYYEITTIFTFFLSLGVIYLFFLTSWILIPLLVFSLLRYSLLRYSV